MKIQRKLNVITTLNICQFLQYPIVMTINYHEKPYRYLISDIDETIAVLSAYNQNSQVYLNHPSAISGKVINATEFLSHDGMFR